MTQARLQGEQMIASYGGARVLDRVDFRVAAGELVAIVGPNGAGKSTLLRALGGAMRLESGFVSLNGKDVAGLTRQAIASEIAVVHQHVEVALGFVVEEVVAMGRAPRQTGWMRASAADEEAVEAALTACDLGELRARRVDSLSGGEQRRVAIARALAQRAPILLLDEPTAHLDVRHAIDVLGLARREVDDRAVACVAVLHDLNLAAAFAERIVILKEGRVVAEGSPDEVITRAALEAAFEAPLYVGRVDEASAPFVVPRVDADRRGSRRDKGRDL